MYAQRGSPAMRGESLSAACWLSPDTPPRVVHPLGPPAAAPVAAAGQKLGKPILAVPKLGDARLGPRHNRCRTSPLDDRTTQQSMNKSYCAKHRHERHSDYGSAAVSINRAISSHQLGISIYYKHRTSSDYPNSVDQGLSQRNTGKTLS